MVIFWRPFFVPLGRLFELLVLGHRSLLVASPVCGFDTSTGVNSFSVHSRLRTIYSVQVFSLVVIAIPDAGFHVITTQRALQVFECIRRLLLTGLLVFLVPDTPGQVAFSCLFAIFR